MEKIKMTEWQKIKLGDICDVVGGGTPSTKVDDYWNGNIPWLTPKDLSGYSNRYISKGERSITEKGLQNSSAKMLPKGTVLLTSRAPIGYVAIANNDVCTNQGFKSIVLNRELFSPEFFYYLLKNNIDYVVGMASGSTFAEISGSQVKNLEFEVPPLEIQRKIAGILGALDDKIEVLRAQNKTLEQMAQAVFQSWFVDFDIVRAKAAGLPAADVCKKYHITPDIYDLFPSAFSADNLPLGWEKKKLGDEFKITMGQSPSGDTYNEEKKGIPFFQGRRDFGFRYPMKRVYCTAPTKFAEKGDVLVSVRAPVGDLNIANFRCCIGRGVAAVRHYTDSTAYTFYHLKNLSRDFDVFNEDGTVFGCIGKDDFLNLNFISCPQETLLKLLPQLDLFENKIYENSKQIRTLEQTRDTLLPQLLGGKIDVENVSLPSVNDEDILKI